MGQGRLPLNSSRGFFLGIGDNGASDMLALIIPLSTRVLYRIRSLAGPLITFLPLPPQDFIGPHMDIPAPDSGTDGRVMSWIFDEFSKYKG